MTMVGTPRAVMHLEAMTDDCICIQIKECKGIQWIEVNCPEHGVDSGPVARYHTHAQQVNLVNRHRRVS